MSDTPPRSEIVDLLHRLAHAADRVPDAELATYYRSCFTDDAVWEVDSPTWSERRVGADSILAGVAERRSSGRNGPGTGVHHHITTVVVDPPGGTAAATWTVRSYYLVTGPDGAVRAAGRYTDRVVRVADQLLIAARAVDPAPYATPAGS